MALSIQPEQVQELKDVVETLSDEIDESRFEVQRTKDRLEDLEHNIEQSNKALVKLKKVLDEMHILPSTSD